MARAVTATANLQHRQGLPMSDHITDKTTKIAFLRGQVVTNIQDNEIVEIEFINLAYIKRISAKHNQCMVEMIDGSRNTLDNEIDDIEEQMANIATMHNVDTTRT